MKQTSRRKPNRSMPAAESALPPGRDWRALALALGGGLAGALAFEPAGLWPLAPLAPLGIFLAVRRAPTLRQAMLAALLGCWVYYFGTIHWLVTIRHYSPLPPLTVVAIFALGLYMAGWVLLPLWALRRWAWPATAGRQFAAFAAIWLVAEWLRTLGRLAMPLGQLGHSWAPVPWAIQPASWFGELGISFQILLIAGLLFFWPAAWGFHRRHQRAGTRHDGQNPVLYAGLWSMVLFMLMLNNAVYLASWRVQMARLAREGTEPALTVAVLQPNIGQYEKLSSYMHPDLSERGYWAELTARRNEELVAAHVRPEWDVLVMPETAYAEIDFFTNAALRRRAGELARRAGADMIFGASRSPNPWADAPLMYNTVYLARPDGSLDDVLYDKMRLVPFGESLPYFELIPGFQDSIVGIGSFQEGAERRLFQTGDFKAGVLICFESTFSQMGRAYALDGADYLAVVTNDAWFGESAGPRMHFNLSLLRAVETRRWVVRSANTGVSAVISPAGEVVEELALGRAGAIEASLQPRGYNTETFFMRWGNTPLMTLALATLALTAWRARRRPAVKAPA